MKDTALYEQLLGLKTPWSVKKADLSLADQCVVVEVVLKKGQVWADPTDATKRAHVKVLERASMAAPGHMSVRDRYQGPCVPTQIQRRHR